MTTALPATTLTADQRRVAARLVYGVSNKAIASQVCLSVDGVASHLSAARKKMGWLGIFACRPRPHPSRRPKRFPTGRQRDGSGVHQPRRDRHTGHRRDTLNADIGNAIGVPADDVRAEIDATVDTGNARNAAHLVGLAHTWGILGTSDTQPATGATATAEPAR